MSSDDKKPAPSTRVLGLADGSLNTDDVETHVMATAQDRIVGWLVVVEGPGTGKRLAVRTGTNAVGRDRQSNRIVLDFGDEFVSRTGHAIIVHDAAQRRFRLIDGGKANRIRLNGRDVAQEAVLAADDRITVGSTVMKFELA